MCSEWHPQGAGARTTGEDKGFRCAHRRPKETECTQETLKTARKVMFSLHIRKYKITKRVVSLKEI